MVSLCSSREVLPLGTDPTSQNVPDPLLNLVLGSSHDPLVGEPVERAQLVVVAVQAPGRVVRIPLAQGQVVETRDAVLVELVGGSHFRRGEGVADLL